MLNLMDEIFQLINGKVWMNSSDILQSICNQTSHWTKEELDAKLEEYFRVYPNESSSQNS